MYCWFNMDFINDQATDTFFMRSVAARFVTTAHFVTKVTNEMVTNREATTFLTYYQCL